MIYRIHGSHYFGDFYVSSSSPSMARAQSMDILTSGHRAAQYGYNTTSIEKYIVSITAVRDGDLKFTPVVHAGEVWKDLGTEYIVMSERDSASYGSKSTLVFRCPVNPNIHMTPERFFVNHPHATRVHP